MSANANGSGNEQPGDLGGEGWDPRTPVPVALELHEVVALAILYERAPDDLDLADEGVWYGASLDLAMLRIGEAMARVSGSKDWLLRAGALRARLDQEAAAS